MEAPCRTGGKQAWAEGCPWKMVSNVLFSLLNTIDYIRVYFLWEI